MIDFSQFSLITFDCYGTLVDWETGLLKALRKVLAAHHLNPDDSRILALYAELESNIEQADYKPYREVLREVVDQMGERLDFKPSPEERDSLAESIATWKPFPDTVAALRALKQKYKLGVISNIDDDLFSATARQLEVPLDFFISSQQTSSYKPSMNNFLQAMREFAVPNKSVLHAAQSLHHDINPAKAVGLTTVWVNRRAGKKGHGATPRATAQPDLEVPDLKTLARLAAASRK